MDLETGLKAHAALVRPGGTLTVLGLALDDLPRTCPSSLTAAACSFALNWMKNGGPVIPGPLRHADEAARATWAQAREVTRRTLPGAVFRRHLLWRYSVTYVRPIE